MTLIITQDTLTPWLKQVPTRLRKGAARTVNRILKHGAAVARRGVAGQRSKDLHSNIRVMPATARKPGYLVSGSTRSIKGFQYQFWVNNNIDITGRFPYFTNGKRVKYGDGRFKAKWRMTPGYFNKAALSMDRVSPKYIQKLGDWLVK